MIITTNKSIKIFFFRIVCSHRFRTLKLDFANTTNVVHLRIYLFMQYLSQPVLDSAKRIVRSLFLINLFLLESLKSFFVHVPYYFPIYTEIQRVLFLRILRVVVSKMMRSSGFTFSYRCGIFIYYYITSWGYSARCCF